MAEYGRAFLEGDDRRIALNFALAENMPVDPGALLAHFSPQLFLIKITPVNPTHRAALNGIVSHVTPGRETYGAVTDLKKAGYDVILSIGELEENLIGSNCGQFVTRVRNAGAAVEGGYTYPLVPGRHETADGEGPGTASR
jgi:23S rRNA (adenine2503-C2)-methyltransferase